MQQKKLLSILLLLVYTHCAYAFTWQVGPSRTYTTPSQVSALVSDGDIVEIDAGIYESDVARWAANNLTIRGVNGLAHLKANGAAYGGKAIWVIAGNNTTVEYIEFSLCSVQDQNGAGIRQEGAGLTVRNSYFHDNENGILAGDNASSNILIEFCEFANNGFGDGYSHNLYINHVQQLTFRYNYSHGTKEGHELKSRATVNYILYNRITNEATGTASRNIDLPNGGVSYIIGNLLQQGLLSPNGNMLGYGLEGLTNAAPHELFLINNTFVNERGAGTFVQIDNGTGLYKSYNNIFAGQGTLLAGNAIAADISTNYSNTNISALNFADPSNYDYRLTGSSPVINAGAAPGADGSFNLTPTNQYQHIAKSEPRLPEGIIDIGAFEYLNVLPVSLVYFNGYRQADKILLQIGLAGTDDLEKIIVEKSIDGFQFSSLQVIDAEKNKNEYTAEDNSFVNNTPSLYYRITLVQLNGKKIYSAVLKFNLAAANVSKVYFAGDNQLFFIPSETLLKNDFQLAIYSAEGRLLYQTKIASGNNSFMVNPVLMLPKGLLIIKATAANTIESFKLVN